MANLHSANFVGPLKDSFCATGPVLARRRIVRYKPRHVRSRQHVRCHAASATKAAAGAPAIIVGAGIAGLASAVSLHKVGVPVVVLERAPVARGEGAAIGLWANAWRALDALGAAEQLRSSYLKLDRVELVSSTGRPLRSFNFRDCGAAGDASEFRGVRRSDLLAALAAQLPPGVVRYGQRVSGFSSSPGGPVTLELEGGERLQGSLLVGADGAGSDIARQLGLQPASYAGYVACRGVAHFPPGLPVPLNTIRQVFGAGVRAGMYPLSPTDAYWYCCWNAPESAPNPSTPEARAQEAAAAVAGWAWGIPDAIANTPPGSLSRSRIVDRWTWGATGSGAVTLAGDAAHPMTPNLGQGACTALEDAVALGRTVRDALAAAGPAPGASGGAALEAALRRYEAERSARCLPLTVRSWAFGFALQLPYAPVVAVRDLFVERLFSPGHFLDHTTFDCGALDGSRVSAVVAKV